MQYFKNSEGKPILIKMVDSIQNNKAYLSEIDGLIGDGDHGMNMNKGFSMFKERILNRNISFTEGLDELGTLLFTEIGGSMGPIYGTLFSNIASAGETYDEIGVQELFAMIDSGIDELFTIVDARSGDKTLIDTLVPARDSLEQSIKNGDNLNEALVKMKYCAAAGRDSTKDMIAKFGRSSRLGERSKGVLDAGATSCCLILTAIADSIIELERKAGDC